MNHDSSSAYRRDLQGLRAVAILLVVSEHAGFPFLPGGFVGVDVFFVLSGYLISRLLIREQAADGGIKLLNFYARRLKRLLPALLVMLSVVGLVASLLLSEHELVAQSASMFYAATWTSNLYFSLLSIDYFAELQMRDLFLHTWSLSLEEQFYLVWPVAIGVTCALVRKRSGNVRLSALLIMFGLLGSSSLGLIMWLTNSKPILAFYLMPSRIWQFAIGATIFVVLHRLELSSAPDLSNRFKQWLGFAGLALIIGAACFLNRGMTYPGVYALAPALGAGLIISAGCRSGANTLLTHTALVGLGDRSYSWYLWHWPVLMLGAAWGIQARPIATTGLVLVSLLLAELSYRWVELPFWKGRLSEMPAVRAILLSVLAMMLVVVLAFKIQTPTIVEGDVGNVSPALAARRDVPFIYAYGCDAWYANSELHPCLIGDSKAPKTVVLFGDSIGAQWVSLLPALFKSDEWRAMILTKSSCPMVDEDFFYERIGQVYDICREWREKSLDFLAALKPDVVFLGSASTYPFSETQWVEGSSRILERLTQTSGHVWVIPGTPKLSFDGPGCLERIKALDHHEAADVSSCREKVVGQKSSLVAGYLAQAVLRFDNANLLDLNDLVCPGGECSAITTDGEIVFRDSQHLTDSMVKAQIQAVSDRLGRWVSHGKDFDGE